MSIFKNNFVVGVTAALAATVIAPILIPAIKRGGRPLAKSLVRGGILLYDKGREAVASAGEMMEDVIAEVRAESLEGQATDEHGTQGVPSGAGFQPHVYSGNVGAGNGASTAPVERGGAT